jgi:UDP-GlcNAc:undecaprenyl-phosphate/decaprenyl-phosphate GlcNAc-1-phosphate transferase
MNAVAFFLTFVLTVVFMFVLRPIASAVGLVDVPGGRKRHGTAVPLIGGVCMSIGLGFGTTLVDHPVFWNPAILGIYLLVIVGTVDDRFDLPPNVRLIAQSCAAMLVVFASGITITSLGAPFFFDLPLGIFSVPFTLLFIVTLINAFNLTDGIDGLAGGLALLSLIAMAIVGVNTDVFGLTVLLIAVLLAFLLFNFPLRFVQPVRTFMGDAGSTFLGLAIASIGVWLSQGGEPRISPVVGLWLVAVPVFDLFSTIIRRLAEGKSPLAPDHGHLHHVLMDGGLSRRATLAWMLTTAAVCVGIGVLGDRFDVPDGVMLIGWFVVGTAYYQMLRNPKVVVDLLGGLRAAVNRIKPKTI